MDAVQTTNAIAPGCCSSFVQVEAEEVVYTYDEPNNGAPPLWCIGSTCIVRVNDDVYVSGIETIPEALPLNNVRWTLHKRSDNQWRMLHRDAVGRTREPSPIACFEDGSLFISVNPSITATDAYDGPANPHLLEISRRDGVFNARPSYPDWEGSPVFTEHSYRGLAADGVNGELLVFNNLGYEQQYWAFRDREGRWLCHGRYVYPVADRYGRRIPLRLCYHNAALAERGAHFFAAADILEPCPAWREFKAVAERSAGTRGDWVFRRLFYYGTRDITREPLSPPVEIASREETAGHLRNLDLFIDSLGRAHLLWLERNVTSVQLRDRFFPGMPMRTSLEYAVIEQGSVARRTTLICGGESEGTDVPGWARFHVTPDGQLFVFCSCYTPDTLPMTGTGPTRTAIGHLLEDGLGPDVHRRNLLLFMDRNSPEPRCIKVHLTTPLALVMNSSPRAGARPSSAIDLLGLSPTAPHELRYAQLRLKSGGADTVDYVSNSSATKA